MAVSISQSFYKSLQRKKWSMSNLSNLVYNARVRHGSTVGGVARF
ncbi:protein of unknown function [Methylocella tundrae]|uniref:Uncharacterized protein n=1 Tax=Methylocella tundrae TaxID=227605 RepID=A0A4U8YXU4_METTU|nr:protein of unknown function [Methylocella tundrae]